MWISDKTKVYFYDYICLYESTIADAFGQYDIENVNLLKRLCDSDMYIARLGKKNKKEAMRHKQYILYDDSKPKRREIATIKNDKAHNLLRHIRNAIAHGNIDKKSRCSKFYTLNDESKGGKTTLQGQVLINDFIPLVNLLIATKLR